MVSFVCDACQETIKKPKLDQHRQRCWATFTCIDCSTTFYGTDYKPHTSCISEAEKYEKSVYKGPKKFIQRVDSRNQNGVSSLETLPSKPPVSIVSQLEKGVAKGKSEDSSAAQENVSQKRKNDQSCSDSDSGDNNSKKKSKYRVDNTPSSHSADHSADEQLTKAKANGKKMVKKEMKDKEKARKSKNKKKQENGESDNQGNGDGDNNKANEKKISEADTLTERMEWDNEVLDKDFSKTLPLAVKAVLKTQNSQMTLKILREKVIKKYKSHPKNKAKKRLLQEEFDKHFKVMSKDGRIVVLM